MFQDETQPEHHLERSAPLPLQPDSPDAEVQRKRMLIALGILVVALAAVVLKDWDFWFPPSPEAQEATATTYKSKITPAPTGAEASSPARERKSAKSAPAAAPAEAPPMSATTERAVLPPLQVEVVAGNQHINLPAKSNAIHLDVNSGSTSSAANAGSGLSVPVTGATTNSGDRVQLSPVVTTNCFCQNSP